MFYKIHNDQTGIYTGKYLKQLGRVSRYVNNHCSHWLLQILLFSKKKERVEHSAKWDSYCLFFDGIYKLPLIYDINWLLLFIFYLFFDRLPICKNLQLDGGKLMDDRWIKKGGAVRISANQDTSSLYTCLATAICICFEINDQIG